MTDYRHIIHQNSQTLPIDVVGIAKDLGLQLDMQAELHPEISSEIAMTPDDHYKISVNINDHLRRKRFSIAHQLGHYLLHREKISRGLDDSYDYKIIVAGNFYNSNVDDKDEHHANRFAEELLIPGKKLRLLFSQGKSIDELADVFFVSKKAIQIRLKSIGMIQ